MFLHSLTILNYKNIREATLTFSDKMNCFVGLNGQGKTNVLDAIYYLSFTKSAYNPIDSLNITHGENLSMIQGEYLAAPVVAGSYQVSCALRRGQKKQFRLGKQDYHRLLDHIGLIPLVMVSPADSELVSEGSDERRRFMDSVIAQCDRTYLDHLTQYNALLKQRNALLKQLADEPAPDLSVLDIYEQQMLAPAQYIFAARTAFIQQFIPYFQQVYDAISQGGEQVSLTYLSQLQTRDLADAFLQTRSRDLVLGWTSQGIHKDDLVMQLQTSEESYPLKQVASQGQQKTYLLAMKLAQALYLTAQLSLQPLLLLDDIFDKLDSERVERIIRLLHGDRFGQIFITDTDRQHLTSFLHDFQDATVFHVENGNIH